MSESVSDDRESRSSRSRRRRGSASTRRARRRQSQSRLLIAVVAIAVLVVGGLIAVTLTGGGSGANNSDIYAEFTQEIVELDNGTTGVALGPEDAPVTVYEYGDFSCPHCFEFSSFFDEAVAEYAPTGDVRFVLVPIIFVNPPTSVKAGGAYYCAAQQGKGFEMHDELWRIFAVQGRNGYTDDNLLGRARVVELDVDEFRQCYDDEATSELLIGISEAASASGVNATPSVFVNDERLQFPSTETMGRRLMEAIEAALEAA